MLEKLTQQKFENQSSLDIIRALLSVFKKRRSTRHFGRANIDLDIVLNAIEIAGTAPSGANKQPWSFGIIANPQLKSQIRTWAENEERDFYDIRAPQRWLDDLKPLHTNSSKKFLTEASYLIPIFYSSYERLSDGEHAANYYVKESVGIATGILISALHLAGLSTLTYTPSNRRALTRILNRPESENTFLVLAVGLPSTEAHAPALNKKTLEQILTIYDGIKERNQKDEFKPATKGEHK